MSRSNSSVQQAIEKLKDEQSLSETEMTSAFDLVMEGGATNKQIENILVALHEKGETADELVGAAKSLRKQMTQITSTRSGLVDTCGTGGSGTNTFNISTAAAIVAAAAGASVAKHGNRKSTSKSGSADVLAELGVNVECSVEQVEKCLNQLGICFCFAPLFHPAVKTVMKVRKKLTHPTIFNLIGPLCNPANAPFQLLGAGRGDTRELLAEALAKLGTTRSIVVHGRDGLGEISVSETTDVSEVRNGHIANSELVPGDFGMENSLGIGLLVVQNPQQSADIINRVLDGQSGPSRDIVIANAAATLWVSGISDDLMTGANRCSMAIDKGHAKEMLKELADMTNKS